MSDSTFQSQLNAFAKVYAASGGSATLRTSDGMSWATSFTSAFLNDQLSLQVAKDGLAQRGLVVTTKDLAAAKTQLEQNFTTGGRSVFGDLPPAYQQSLIEGVAAQSVLADAVLAEATSDEALRRLYESEKDKYSGDLACVSHILVLAGSGSSNTSPTEAQYATALNSINAIRAQVTPANFSTIASSTSQDTGSAADGGRLGCASKGTYVDAFDQSVWTLPVGQISEPVRTPYGYHLILVTARGRLGFDDLKSTLELDVRQSAQQLVDLELARLARAADVSVNGRYGVFDPQTGRITTPLGAITPSASIDGTSITGR